MKGIVRHQSSARPATTIAKTFKKRRKGRRGGVQSKADKRTDKDKDFIMVKAHDNNQSRTVLAKMTFRERRRLSLSTHGAARRACEQLCQLGKLDRAATVKSEFNNVSSRWGHYLPSGIPFTVEGLLRAMVLKQIEPLYDANGASKASEV